MKVCEVCEAEIYTLDGENRCPACEKSAKQRARRRANAAARRDLMESCGLVRVRGALGGTYYE